MAGTTIYHTATTLDGFIADPDDSLDWLFTHQMDDDNPLLNFDHFLPGVGAMVTGATSYCWIRDHLAKTGEPWPYTAPLWVMTHRTDLEPLADNVTFASGDVRPVHEAMVAAAGDRDRWVIGGGDLAGQLADAGLLDEVVVSIAATTLGAGRPLLPRRLSLELLEAGRNGDFCVARYAVRGPLGG